MLAELIDGHDLYLLEDYPLAVPQGFNDFLRAIHIDYDEAYGDYEVKQYIKE